MEAMMSSTVMWLGIRSVIRSAMAVSQSPSGPSSSSISLSSVEADLFLDAVLGGVKGHEVRHIDHAVGEDLHILVAHLDDGLVDASSGEVVGLGTGNEVPGHHKDLAGEGIGNRLGGLLAGKPGPDVHLLIELVAAHLAHIVAVGIEEEPFQMGHSGLHRGRLTGAQTAVDLQQGLFPGLAGVLFQGAPGSGDPRRTWP